MDVVGENEAGLKQTSTRVQLFPIQSTSHEGSQEASHG